MSLSSITGISKVERLFDDISKTAPEAVDKLINDQSKQAKKIIQKRTPKRKGTLRKSIANKKIRKANEFTKVISINKRKAPYGYKINAKRSIIKKGKIVGRYTDGQFFENSQKDIEQAVEAAVNTVKVI